MRKISWLVLPLIIVLAQNVFAQACVVCGCNNEICSKAGETQFSTCLWKAEYECYQKFGVCEANAQGECGWRQTQELTQCLQLRQQQVEAADAFSD